MCEPQEGDHGVSPWQPFPTPPLPWRCLQGPFSGPMSGVQPPAEVQEGYESATHGLQMGYGKATNYAKLAFDASLYDTNFPVKEIMADIGICQYESFRITEISQVDGIRCQAYRY